MIPQVETYYTDFIALLQGLPGGQPTVAFILFAIIAILLYSLVVLVISVVRKLSGKTETELDDIIVDRVRRPLKYFAIVIAIYLSIGLVYPGFAIGDYSLDKAFLIALLLGAAYGLDRVVDGVMVWYGKEIAPKTTSKFDDEVFPLFRKIVRAIIYILVVLIILSELGVEIAPLIAGLGIAGLAVALALQDTLQNFFSGVYILADKPIKPGDYIEMEGIAGTVEEVGWRTTRVTTWDNNNIYIPNSKVAQSIITNYYTPDMKMGYAMEFGASYDDDPDKVLAALLKAAQEVAKRTGKVVGEPSVRADNFGESSVNYKVFVKVPTRVDKFTIKGEMVKEVYRQFKKAGLTIPFPTRTVYVEGEAKPVKLTKRKRRAS